MTDPTAFVPLGDLIPQGYPDTGEQVTVAANDLHKILDVFEDVIEDRVGEQAALTRLRRLLDDQAPELVGYRQSRLEEFWGAMHAAAGSGRLTYRSWSEGSDDPPGGLGRCGHCGGLTGHVTCEGCGTHIAEDAGRLWFNPAVEADEDGRWNYAESDVKVYCQACAITKDTA